MVIVLYKLHVRFTNTTMVKRKIQNIFEDSMRNFYSSDFDSINESDFDDHQIIFVTLILSVKLVWTVEIEIKEQC